MRSDADDILAPHSQFGAAVETFSPYHPHIDHQAAQSSLRMETLAASMALPPSQEDLAQCVQAFHQDWSKFLRQKFDQLDLEKFPIITDPFEQGVKALQKCFRGLLPSTLDEIFSLLLIASVAVIRVWHSIRSSFHSTFFENALEWHRAIPSLAEKQVFFKGIGCLFRLQPNYQQWQANHLHPSSRGLYQVELSGEPPNLANYSDHSMRQADLRKEDVTSFGRPKDMENLTLLHELKEGCVLIICAEYLNHIEHQNIARRIQPQSRLYNRSQFTSQTLISEVLDPLNKLWTGFKSLHDRAELNISLGLIKSPRELELMLIFGADPRSNDCAKCFAKSDKSPWTKYIEYRRQVTSFCDNFMGAVRPDWRDEYYATELDWILTTYLTSKQWQLGNSDAIPTTGGSGNNLRPTLIDTEMAPLSNLAKADFIIDSTAGSQTSPFNIPSDGQVELSGSGYCESFGQIYHALNEETSAGLSEQLSDEYPGQFFYDASWYIHHELPIQGSRELPAVSTSAQPTNDPILSRCENCGEVFSSNPKDLPHNKQRHQDTVCNRNDRFECSEPGCNKRFPRKDYLNAHILKAHEESHQPGRRRSQRAANSSTVSNQPMVNLQQANIF